MKINVKSIIKNGFLALGLIFAINSAANPVTVSPIGEFCLRLTGIGLATAIAKYKNASQEFINSFLYTSGIFFAERTTPLIPNVSKGTENAIDMAGFAALKLPLLKQLLDLMKKDCSNEKAKRILVNLIRYGTAFFASIVAQETMVGGYGVLKTLISNQIIPAKV